MDRMDSRAIAFKQFDRKINFEITSVLEVYFNIWAEVWWILGTSKVVVGQENNFGSEN